jgi:hypothetical protein
LGDSEFEKLIYEEQQLRKKLHKIGQSGSKQDKRDYARAWYDTAARTLMECGRRSKSGTLKGKAPAELFYAFSKISADLAKGVIPELVTDVAARGRSLPSGEEEYDRNWAVLYLKCVDEGKIPDRRHNKTVRELYGVRDSTVRCWRKLDIPKWMEAFKNEPQQIVENMKVAAGRYRVCRRGISAHYQPNTR